MGLLDPPAARNIDAFGNEIVRGTKEIARLIDFNKSASSLDIGIPPILDLNYADKMSLYGFETYTCSATQSYTDALGNAQSAAINVAAFDRTSVNG